MERIVSQEERIRRAEEIVALRRSARDNYGVDRLYTRRDTAETELPPKKNFIIKRMFKQIIICLILYTIFFVVKNQNFIFSQEFINKTQEILSYDVNFVELYNTGISFFQNQYNSEQENQGGAVEQSSEEKVNDEENKEEKQEEEKKEDDEKNKTEEKGSEDTNETEKTETEEELSQMEKDAKYVKEKLALIKPVEGVISSEFGDREETSSVVTEEHKGIDIAANTGAKIVAAMDGVVDIATTSSTYGKYIKLTNEDITTIYAHCSKLYVKEGEKVKKGQEIAEVGSTGASTGPHLHFEIKVSDRHINPRLVIEF